MTGRFVALVTAGALTVAVFMPASTARASSPAGLAGSPARTVQARVSSWPTGVSAAEAAIADVRTGKILWSRELNTERPIASITKVMTALVVIRSGGLGRVLTVPKAVIGYVDYYGASSAGLRPGDRLTVNQLLSAMLLPSGADAAYTLAAAYGPGISGFVRKMNATAHQLGMYHTNFSNFDGLPYPYHNSDYSTAGDLLKLARAAMWWPTFRAVVAERSYHLAGTRWHKSYTWYNTDPLLGHYPGAIGIKTGWTPFSGHCLLFEVDLHGITLVGVNLDSSGVGSTVNGDDATRMLDWAFTQPGL